MLHKPVNKTSKKKTGTDKYQKKASRIPAKQRLDRAETTQTKECNLLPAETLALDRRSWEPPPLFGAPTARRKGTSAFGAGSSTRLYGPKERDVMAVIRRRSIGLIAIITRQNKRWRKIA